MIDLLSTLGTPEADDRRLREIRLGTKPANLLLFTKEGDKVLLHWEDDPTTRTFVVCPGAGCPACLLSEKPSRFWLLPAYDLGAGRVGVLRIPSTRGPESLAGQLVAVLRRADLADVAVRIMRDGGSYTVVACKLTEHADRGVQAIQQYLADPPSLVTAFTALDLEEYREIPRIRKLLDAIDMASPVQPVIPPAPRPTSSNPPVPPIKGN